MGGVGGGVRVDVNKEQGGCEQRIEVFGKIQKKIFWGWEAGGGVRMNVNKELKIVGKFTKKSGGGGGGGGGGGRVGGGSGWM